MENDKKIAAINNLIEINHDRVEGYDTAAKETNESDLKRMFAELSSTSRDNLDDLRGEIENLGGAPEEGTRVTGKFFRVWMDVKAALTGNDRHQILSSCEFGEDKALEAYDDALENSDNGLDSSQLGLIRSQQARLRADHDKVKSMRDVEV